MAYLYKDTPPSHLLFGLCASVCFYVCAHVCVHMEARGQPQVSFPRGCPPWSGACFASQATVLGYQVCATTSGF